jgi:transposase
MSFICTQKKCMINRRRNVVERCVNRLKRYRGVVARCAKRAVNHGAMIVVASLMIWLGR